MDLGPVWQNFGESISFSSTPFTFILAWDIVHTHTNLCYRKPQASKTKHGIQDWHLMVFVSILVLVDVIFLIFYTLLEAFVDNFGVLRVPNKENISSIRGVRRSF